MLRRVLDRELGLDAAQRLDEKAGLQQKVVNQILVRETSLQNDEKKLRNEGMRKEKR